jgi:hypothetical protein
LLRDPNLAEGRLYAVVTPVPAQGSFHAEVLDTRGHCYLRLTGYQTVALPSGVDIDRLKNLQAVMSGEALLVA